jgi:Capsule polysaccharide export protein
MEEKQIRQPRKSEPIDFGAIWAAIKKHRKLYYEVLPVAFVISLIIGVSIPKTYECKILLAPEMGGSSSSIGSLASLASSFGVNLGGGGSANGDAITPTLYPDLMKSVDFKTALFPVLVKSKKDKESKTYYDYLKNDWKEPWWKDLFGLMAPPKMKDTLVNIFELTGEQARIAGLINKNVICKIDKKTSLISINVTAQDPHIAAQLADSVKNRLQDFLTDYKTSKARHDLEYAETLLRQAKKDYEHARRLYVDFMDANQDVSLMSAQQKQMDLENDMQLQYNNYNALSAQVISAKAKVQEVTPAFTPLQSATVPLSPASPKKGQIVIICLILTVFFTSLYILIKENQLRPLLGLS